MPGNGNGNSAQTHQLLCGKINRILAQDNVHQCSKKECLTYRNNINNKGSCCLGGTIDDTELCCAVPLLKVRVGVLGQGFPGHHQGTQAFSAKKYI